jgi:hypothetical protein
MSRYAAELAKINWECSAQLLQDFSRQGIRPWWSSEGGRRAVFNSVGIIPQMRASGFCQILLDIFKQRFVVN